MSEPQPASNITAPGASAEAKNVSLIYILYLVSFVVGITFLVGLVMAYVNKDSAPEWLQSHYRYQIRTFWIGLLYGTVSAIATLAVIGLVGLAFLAVWIIVRCAKGLRGVQAGEPVPNAGTWLW
jgi:uncharacterized membrane protein